MMECRICEPVVAYFQVLSDYMLVGLRKIIIKQSEWQVSKLICLQWGHN